jgi:hypothetical protein
MKFCYLLVSICMAQFMFPGAALAHEKGRDEVYFSLPLTTSLGSRGVITVIQSETPITNAHAPGRYLIMQCFQIAAVGSDPIPVPAGFSGGDRYTFRSGHFSYPLVAVFLTDKNEPITVYRNEEGSLYNAEMPGPWAEGTDRTLIRFDGTGRGEIPPPMSAKISGTMADHNILIALHGKGQAYFFGFDYSDIMRRWVRLPSSVALSATTQSSPPKTKTAVDPVGDKIRVRLVDQQRCGVDAHLLTVMAEAPLDRGQGRRVAFYYFVQDSPGGSDVKFLTSRTSDDGKAVGTEPSDEAGIKPSGTLIGSIRTWNAKFDLVVGQAVSHFIYDYSSRRWVEKKN